MKIYVSFKKNLKKLKKIFHIKSYRIFHQFFNISQDFFKNFSRENKLMKRFKDNILLFINLRKKVKFYSTLSNKPKLKLESSQ